MCQVGEMRGGGNRYGVEGILGHLLLRTTWRTLRSHQHHSGVGLPRVVGLHHTRLHMGLLESINTTFTQEQDSRRTRGRFLWV